MYKFFFKRVIDIILSLIALIILIPILLPVIIILLLTGENYVFYFQERIGYRNSKFRIIKFATMLKDSPNIGTKLHTTTTDPRILPFGKFLRSTKINELPQLFNILIGDMSIVGPRPLVDKTFDPYPENIKNSIYNIKPGLSGIGSIIFRNEEELMSNTKMNLDDYYREKIAPFKGELELWYQKNISFIIDLKIILITIWIVFFSKSNIISFFFKNLPKNKK
tara:strand:- start:4871 stop:5536 length:666 start_codon:yes stop_codon:yes gene_type:complete